MDEVGSISDPAGLLIGLGAFAGLFAAAAWIRVVTSIQAMQSGRGANWSRVGTAAVATAFAIGLASFGFLLGRFTGRF